MKYRKSIFLSLATIAALFITFILSAHALDIEIESIGLRPGEKLYEELMLESEEVITTKHEKIFVTKSNNYDYDQFLHLVKTFRSLVDDPMIDLKKELSRIESTYIIDYSTELMLSFSYEGIYRFRFDTNQQESLIITNFDKNFPKVKSAEELIEPLVYITTTADYDRLINDDNKKLASDNFWLDIGGSTGRARELIRIYYNRVYFSNYYFSNIVPGWKTDRGMIYIVYGPPQNMEKTANSETWIYYTKGASNAINFTFDYKPDLYNLDNFVLRRSESHEWHWKEAIDSWREGEIYLMD